jgi:hypothetical protein
MVGEEVYLVCLGFQVYYQGFQVCLVACQVMDIILLKVKLIFSNIAI